MLLISLHSWIFLVSELTNQVFFFFFFLGNWCSSCRWPMDKRISWVWVCYYVYCWGGWSLYQVFGPIGSWGSCHYSGEGKIFICFILDERSWFLHFGCLALFQFLRKLWMPISSYEIESCFLLSTWSFCGSRSAVCSSSSSLSNKQQIKHFNKCQTVRVVCPESLSFQLLNHVQFEVIL